VENGEGHYRVVWTGRELLGWGLGLDAAYNPATNRWRRLAGSIGAPSIVAWTGSQVLVWGGGCCGEDSADGAAYNPATDSWQAIPRGPLAGRHTAGAWTGSELVVVGGETTDGKIFRDAATYNPASRTWRRLPPLPAARAGATVTWTGTEVLVVAGYGPSGGTRGSYTDGVAYNPAANRWRRLPATETSRTGHAAVWTGRDLLVWGGSTHRTGTWVTPPHGLAYDPASNRWSALPKSALRGRSNPVTVWTGSQLLVWGGIHLPDGRNVADGADYTPSPQ
jgi:N-acetylneuraminic acid mutarotase